jgi:large subunit ribosomal protein L21
MYAIVDIAGQQFKVEKDQKIFVHRLDGEAGSNMFFDKVLLIDNGKNILIGNPLISDALISVKILSHLKGDKVKVFKKKRRKAYQILKGHRQLLTEIQIDEILEKGGGKFIKEAAAKKPEKEPVAKVKKEQPVISPVTEAVEKTPEIVAKKETSKKETSKKVTSKKVTGKPAEKAKTVTEKKASTGRTGKSKASDPEKEKIPSAAKSSKSKPKPTQKASSKKTDKPSKK